MLRIEKIKVESRLKLGDIIGDVEKGNLGVKKYSFLPYRGIIPVLSYYFYKSNKRAILPYPKEVMEKWVWRISFSKRYGSAAPTKMGEDEKLFDQIIMNTPVSVGYSGNKAV